MIKWSITLLFAIFMLIPLVLNLNDQLNFDHLDETSFAPLMFDHEIHIVERALFLELQVTKILGTYRSNENSAIHTMRNDQTLLLFIEYFPHDKPFLVVKKFQSNYLS